MFDLSVTHSSFVLTLHDQCFAGVLFCFYLHFFAHVRPRPTKLWVKLSSFLLLLNSHLYPICVKQCFHLMALAVLLLNNSRVSLQTPELSAFMTLIVSSVLLLVGLLSSEYRFTAEGSNTERRTKTNLRHSRWTTSQRRNLIM